LLAEVAATSGGDAVMVVTDMLAWARNHQLRVEFGGTGSGGSCDLQLDGGPDGTQFTFVIRTRGDVTIQFQYMKTPSTPPSPKRRSAEGSSRLFRWQRYRASWVGHRSLYAS
jgi:hypothetical protein